MISYYTINWDFNSDSIEHYDIMPYLYRCYDKEKKKNKMKIADVSFDFLKKLIKDSSMYMYWSRCEYETIVHGFPHQKNDHKMDIHEQVLMNLDNITRLMYNDIHKIK